MAFNYSGLEKTADSLISQFGRRMRYRRYNRGIPDTDRPWELNTSAPFDDHPDVYAVFLDFVEGESGDTVVEENDCRILVAAKNLTIIPTAGDVIIDDRGPSTAEGGAPAGSVNDVYMAISVKSIIPGDTAVAYDMQIRK